MKSRRDTIFCDSNWNYAYKVGLGRKPVALFRQYSLTDGKMCEMKRAFSLANPSPVWLQSQEMGKEEINDDRLEEWTNGRVTVNIQMGGHAVTGEALFRVYSVSMREFIYNID